MEKSPNQQCNLLPQWLDRTDLSLPATPGGGRLETVWTDGDDAEEERLEEEEEGGAGV